jgi:hypothetical protein
MGGGMTLTERDTLTENFRRFLQRQDPETFVMLYRIFGVELTAREHELKHIFGDWIHAHLRRSA